MMSPVVREAVRRVRESLDFGLLDMLELLDRRNAGEKGAIAVVRSCDRTLIGYGHSVDLNESGEIECPACDGDGEIDVDTNDGRMYTVECPRCDGDCVINADDLGDSMPPVDRLHWRTLNGEPAELANTVGSSHRPYSFVEARAEVNKVKDALEAEEHAT